MDFSNPRTQWFAAALFVLALGIFNLVAASTVLAVVFLVAAAVCAAVGLMTGRRQGRDA